MAPMVFVWGAGERGSMGTGERDVRVDVVWDPPRGIAARWSGTVLFVSCGLHHSALVTDEGMVFTWGANG